MLHLCCVFFTDNAQNPRTLLGFLEESCSSARHTLISPTALVGAQPVGVLWQVSWTSETSLFVYTTRKHAC